MMASGADPTSIFCQEHPDASIIEDYSSGDQICSECGLVLGDRVIDVGPEWRTFLNEMTNADQSRVGGPTHSLLNGSDLTTITAGGSGNTSYGSANYSNCSEASTSDRALVDASREIFEMAEKINLPQTIVDRAKHLFQTLQDKKNLKSGSTTAAASTCLYISCCQHDVPRTMKEICAVSYHSKTEIGRSLKKVLAALDISLEPITVEDFMPRFCSKLSLPNAMKKTATCIARSTLELDLVPGRCPIAVAAAAIYLASQVSEVKRSLKEVGDVAGVSDVTISQSYKAMVPRAAELFPKDFQFFTAINELLNS